MENLLKMIKETHKIKLGWFYAALAVVFVCLFVYGWNIVSGGGWLSLILTPDQKGRLLFQKGRYAEAAQTFRNPFWQATALYREGEFEKASGIFTGFDTAEGAFNHGNALAMQGKYNEAIIRYERALSLKSGWKDAEINLEIARQLAKRLARKGGEGTGGKLGADEIVFSENKSKNQPGGQETVEGNPPISDAEFRKMWLRRVQTKPADFLRAKFAYQQANSKDPE